MGEAAALDERGDDAGDVGLPRRPRRLGPADLEQLLGELREAGHVDGELVEHGLVLRGAARAAAGELDPALEERHRRAELVAGVVDEPAFALEGVLERREHVVERVPEPGDLVVAVGRHVEAQAVRAAGDLLGAPAVPLDRAQRRPGEEVPHHRGHDERGDPGQHQLQEQLAQRLVPVVAAHADDEVLPGVAEGGDLHPVGLLRDGQQLADVLGQHAGADVREVRGGHERGRRRGAAGVEHASGAVEHLPPGPGGVRGAARRTPTPESSTRRVRTLVAWASSVSSPRSSAYSTRQ